LIEEHGGAISALSRIGPENEECGIVQDTGERLLLPSELRDAWEQERERAEQERERAEQERARADALAAQLRELGIEPNS